MRAARPARGAVVLSWRRGFILLWALLLAIKLWMAWRLPLFSDEAWYWLEGQRLAWAYSDLPGLTAWLARLGTAVAGTTALGLRWPFLALGAAVPWLCVRIGARWLDAQAGWQAGVIALLLPLSAALGVLALPDVPLVFASVLALDAGLAMLERARARDGVQLALALVLGATSHYRFAIALAGLAVGVLAARGGRALLRRRDVQLALLAGALAWLPVLAFNLHWHDAGLRFQFVDRHPWRFHAYGLRLQALQPLLTGPLLYAGLLWCLWQAWRRRADSRWCLLLGAAGLPWLVYVGLGPFVDIQRVSFHWLLSSYLLAATALPALLREGGHTRWRGWILASNGVLCTVLWVLALQLVLPGGVVRLQRLGMDPKMFTHTGDVAATVRARLAAMPADTALVADDFMLAAKLAFALDAPARVWGLDHHLDAKHGRAVQRAIWGRDEQAVPRLRARPVLLAVDEAALHLETREPWNRHLCALFPGLRDVGAISLDAGRRQVLLYRRDPGASGACDYPALAFMRTPADGAVVSGSVELSGWATQDRVGVAGVEVLLDGRAIAKARYGIEDVSVRSRWPDSDDPAQPDVGFAASVDLRGVVPGEHALALRVSGRDGRVRVLEQRTIRVLAR